MATSFSQTELDREALVKTMPCPVCGVAPGRRCRHANMTFPACSHTGRYNLAVKAGLVPALPGGGHG